jgi:hypothetical protein
MCLPAVLGAAGGLGTAAGASSAALSIQGLSAGIGAVSKVAGVMASNKAAKQNAQSALDAYFLKTRLNNQRLRQEQVQASQVKSDADLKALKSQGTALAAGAGAGVQGKDLDQLMKDFERSEGLLANRIDQKLNNMADQAAVENLAFQSEAQNRINSQQPIGFAESIFKIADPLMGFGIDYYESKARMSDLTPSKGI